MRKLLYVDSTIRKESRTRDLAQSFLNEVPNNVEVIHLKLTDLDLKPLINEDFLEREELLESSNFDHPRFKYAYQLAAVDEILIAAPFWDLSFPSILKIYIEACAVDGITFSSNKDGLIGLVKANNLVYLSTRGGFYEGKEEDQGTEYLKHISKFFGAEGFHSIGADGMDVHGFNSKASLDNAKEKASELAKEIFR